MSRMRLLTVSARTPDKGAMAVWGRARRGCRMEARRRSARVRTGRRPTPGAISRGRWPWRLSRLVSRCWSCGVISAAIRASRCWAGRPVSTGWQSQARSGLGRSNGPGRELLEELQNERIERNLAARLYNRRGLTVRDPEEGGKQERALADRYRASQHLLRQLAPDRGRAAEPRLHVRHRRPRGGDQGRTIPPGAADVKRSGRRDRPPRGTAEQMLMAVAQSAMHNWLDHPFAVSRPRPSPAGVPARCGSLRCAVHEVHGGCISGRRQVDGGCYAWDVSRRPGPSARIRLGGPCPGVLTGREPRIQGFCLRVWRSSGPCGGLYVPVRGIGDAGAQYSGKRARRKCHAVSFAQVSGSMEVQAGAISKTVGSTSAQPLVRRPVKPLSSWDGLRAGMADMGAMNDSCTWTDLKHRVGDGCGSFRGTV